MPSTEIPASLQIVASRPLSRTSLGRHRCSDASLFDAAMNERELSKLRFECSGNPPLAARKVPVRASGEPAGDLESPGATKRWAPKTAKVGWIPD